MRVLVCGSRDYTNRFLVRSLLSDYRENSYDLNSRFTVIAGAAHGADSLAADWAKDLMTTWGGSDVELEEYPANWDRHGKAAGVIRNLEMLRDGKPDLVLAFVSKPLAESKGTAHMVKAAREAGVKTVVVEGPW